MRIQQNYTPNMYKSRVTIDSLQMRDIAIMSETSVYVTSLL